MPRNLRTALRRLSAVHISLVISALFAFGQTSASEKGIPVTDPLVIAKCGKCHTSDAQGNMQRISWERSTPEGWQLALRRMILTQGVMLSPAEARSIVKYLSADHGLAPEEAKAVIYDAERRMHQETNIPDDSMQHACARCHNFARVLSWRRSADDWKQLADWHTMRFQLPINEQALAYIMKAAPLHTPEWDAWSSTAHSRSLAGRWLVTAYVRGRGAYYGEMQVEPSADGDFTTTVRLTSVKDGSKIVRTGRGVIYGANAWRGRSEGMPSNSALPDDLSSEAREVLWVAPDQTTAEGRWYWGQYQEFGFDVKLRRATDGPSLLLVEHPALKTGSHGDRIRLIGDHLPAQLTPADLQFGPGVTVQRIVSSTPTELIADVDVAADAAFGKRDVTLQKALLPGGVSVYDRVDYIKVVPDQAMAAFGNDMYKRGYQQFDAVAYQRGPDGRLHTPDDVEIGPLDPSEVTWSLEVFYSQPGSNTDNVGKISPEGFFTPAAMDPKTNFDVWVVATMNKEKSAFGKPLVGKSYMVVTVPVYTMNGHQYVRDLDRWVDNGPAR